MSSTSWWLQDSAGARRRIRAGGVLIGRSTDCDIVLAEPQISRHHALVYLEGGVPKLVVLGTGDVRVQDQDVRDPRDLEAGERIDVGALQLSVVSGAQSGGPPKYLLQLIRGGAYSVQGPRFTIGGDAEDDLNLPTLPPHAITIEPHEGFLSVETSVSGIRVGGRELPPTELGSLRDGGTLKHGDTTLRVVAVDSSASAKTRQGFDVAEGPVSVALTRLPRGGRLHVQWEDNEGDVYLAERRFALVEALVAPASGGKGDFLEDAVVMERVWPGEDRNRTHLNTLIHRTRKDLVAAGLDGPALIERAEGGGATRFAISELCHVVVGEG
jgi:hypothetical protein